MRAEGSLSAAVPVIGIIKAPLASEEEEAASQANGWPPSTTGVATFRRDYFNCIQTELYADEAQEAYAHVENRVCTAGQRGPSGWQATADSGLGQPEA